MRNYRRDNALYRSGCGTDAPQAKTGASWHPLCLPEGVAEGEPDAVIATGSRFVIAAVAFINDNGADIVAIKQVVDPAKQIQRPLMDRGDLKESIFLNLVG